MTTTPAARPALKLDLGTTIPSGTAAPNSMYNTTEGPSIISLGVTARSRPGGVGQGTSRSTDLPPIIESPLTRYSRTLGHSLVKHRQQRAPGEAVGAVRSRVSSSSAGGGVRPERHLGRLPSAGDRPNDADGLSPRSDRSKGKEMRQGEDPNYTSGHQAKPTSKVTLASMTAASVLPPGMRHLYTEKEIRQNPHLSRLNDVVAKLKMAEAIVEKWQEATPTRRRVRADVDRKRELISLEEAKLMLLVGRKYNLDQRLHQLLDIEETDATIGMHHHAQVLQREVTLSPSSVALQSMSSSGATCPPRHSALECARERREAVNRDTKFFSGRDKDDDFNLQDLRQLIRDTEYQLQRISNVLPPEKETAALLTRVNLPWALSNYPDMVWLIESMDLAFVTDPGSLLLTEADDGPSTQERSRGSSMAPTAPRQEVAEDVAQLLSTASAKDAGVADGFGDTFFMTAALDDVARPSSTSSHASSRQSTTGSGAAVKTAAAALSMESHSVVNIDLEPSMVPFTLGLDEDSHRLVPSNLKLLGFMLEAISNVEIDDADRAAVMASRPLSALPSGKQAVSSNPNFTVSPLRSVSDAMGDVTLSCLVATTAARPTSDGDGSPTPQTASLEMHNTEVGRDDIESSDISSVQVVHSIVHDLRPELYQTLRDLYPLYDSDQLVTNRRAGLTKDGKSEADYIAEMKARLDRRANSKAHVISSELDEVLSQLGQGSTRSLPSSAVTTKSRHNESMSLGRTDTEHYVPHTPTLPSEVLEGTPTDTEPMDKVVISLEGHDERILMTQSTYSGLTMTVVGFLSSSDAALFLAGMMPDEAKVKFERYLVRVTNENAELSTMASLQIISSRLGNLKVTPLPAARGSIETGFKCLLAPTVTKDLLEMRPAKRKGKVTFRDALVFSEEHTTFNAFASLHPGASGALSPEMLSSVVSPDSGVAGSAFSGRKKAGSRRGMSFKDGATRQTEKIGSVRGKMKGDDKSKTAAPDRKPSPDPSSVMSTYAAPDSDGAAANEATPGDSGQKGGSPWEVGAALAAKQHGQTDSGKLDVAGGSDTASKGRPSAGLMAGRGQTPFSTAERGKYTTEHPSDSPSGVAGGTHGGAAYSTDGKGLLATVKGSGGGGGGANLFDERPLEDWGKPHEHTLMDAIENNMITLSMLQMAVANNDGLGLSQGAIDAMGLGGLDLDLDVLRGMTIPEQAAYIMSRIEQSLVPASSSALGGAVTHGGGPGNKSSFTNPPAASQSGPLLPPSLVISSSMSRPLTAEDVLSYQIERSPIPGIVFDRYKAFDESIQSQQPSETNFGLEPQLSHHLSTSTGVSWSARRAATGASSNAGHSAHQGASRSKGPIDDRPFPSAVDSLQISEFGNTSHSQSVDRQIPRNWEQFGIIRGGSGGARRPSLNFRLSEQSEVNVTPATAMFFSEARKEAGLRVHGQLAAQAHELQADHQKRAKSVKVLPTLPQIVYSVEEENLFKLDTIEVKKPPGVFVTGATSTGRTAVLVPEDGPDTVTLAKALHPVHKSAVRKNVRNMRSSPPKHISWTTKRSDQASTDPSATQSSQQSKPHQSKAGFVSERQVNDLINSVRHTKLGPLASSAGSAPKNELERLQMEARELYMQDPLRYDAVADKLLEAAMQLLAGERGVDIEEFLGIDQHNDEFVKAAPITFPATGPYCSPVHHPPNTVTLVSAHQSKRASSTDAPRIHSPCPTLQPSSPPFDCLNEAFEGQDEDASPRGLSRRRRERAVVLEVLDSSPENGLADPESGKEEVQRILYEQMKAKVLLQFIVAQMRGLWAKKSRETTQKFREKLGRTLSVVKNVTWDLERYRIMQVTKLINLLDRRTGRRQGWLPYYTDDNVFVQSDCAEICPRFVHYHSQQKVVRAMVLARRRKLLPIRLVQRDVIVNWHPHLLFGYRRHLLPSVADCHALDGQRPPMPGMFRAPTLGDMLTVGERWRYRRRLQFAAPFQRPSKQASPCVRRENDLPRTLH